MEKIEIEEAVPVDNSRQSRLYPFGEMKAGDSFLVPAETAEGRDKIHLSVAAAARRVAKRTGHTFRVKKISQAQIGISPHLDPGEKGAGVRCWRIE
jgi:hypothetical protein